MSVGLSDASEGSGGCRRGHRRFELPTPNQPSFGDHAQPTWPRTVDDATPQAVGVVLKLAQKRGNEKIRSFITSRFDLIAKDFSKNNCPIWRRLLLGKHVCSIATFDRHSSIGPK